MTQNFFYPLANLVTLPLVLPDLPSQLMPLALSLLQFPLRQLLFPFYYFVPFQQPTYFRLQLFQTTGFHRAAIRKISKLSVKSTMFVVKLILPSHSHDFLAEI
jgi:hypothetical protein